MTNETCAGLSEKEADRALCAWLNERAPDVFTAYRMPFCPYPRMSESCFLSHDSIHRVLDAMNHLERWHYWRSVRLLPDFVGAIAGRDEAALFATPAQKADAALRALGLDKEKR